MMHCPEDCILVCREVRDGILLLHQGGVAIPADLHLLLSRTVVPAPSVPLLQAAEAASSLSASASVFGMVPQVRDPSTLRGQ